MPSRALSAGVRHAQADGTAQFSGNKVITYQNKALRIKEVAIEKIQFLSNVDGNSVIGTIEMIPDGSGGYDISLPSNSSISTDPIAVTSSDSNRPINISTSYSPSVKLSLVDAVGLQVLPQAYTSFGNATSVVSAYPATAVAKIGYLHTTASGVVLSGMQYDATQRRRLIYSF